MKKIELEIVALSHSITQTHSYAVVLGEINGLRRLPIVIGGFEAQAIAVALEKMHPSRPLTHDLMKNFMTAFSIDLQERKRSPWKVVQKKTWADYPSKT
jgi:bifunctional DNase/RNase